MSLYYGNGEKQYFTGTIIVIISLQNVHFFVGVGIYNMQQENAYWQRKIQNRNLKTKSWGFWNIDWTPNVYIYDSKKVLNPWHIGMVWRNCTKHKIATQFYKMQLDVNLRWKKINFTLKLKKAKQAPFWLTPVLIIISRDI